MADIILNNEIGGAITLGTPDQVQLLLEPVAQPAIVLSGGLTGPAGVGVPSGGTAGQVLAKNSGTDYDTEWVNQTGGGGSGAVDSVNSQTGVVVLDTDDISDSGAVNKYVTAAEKTKLSNLSGTNTGDQDLSGYVPTSRTVNAKALSSNITLNQDDVGDGTTYKQYSQTEKTKLAAISGTNTGDQTITLTGDVTGSGTGSFVTAIGSGVIVNADVNSSAAIALGKLAATTVSRALVSDGSGFITPSTTTATEIGYVNGVTSAIQTQLNGKQATGNYITALTSDVTASGPGSAVATLATVNSNVGSFGSATQIPTFTVNAKGLTTAASNTSIQIAESQVTNLVSDLSAKGDFSSNTATSVDSEIVLFSGTGGKTGKRATGSGIAKLTSGVLSTATAGTDYYNPGGTDVAIADGGTGASTKAAGFDALSPLSASGDILYGGASGTGTRLAKGSDGQVLTLASGLPSWSAPTGGNTTNNFNTMKMDQTPASGTYGTLAGTVNGSNAVFTVSNGLYVSGSLDVFLNGQLQTQGAGYDWVETVPGSGTFTFNVAPPTGSIIFVEYQTSAPSSSTLIQVLSTTAGINAKSTGTTTLYTVPSGQTAIITGAIVRCTAASSITNGPTLGIGIATGEDDVFASTNLVALTSTTAVFGFSTVGMSRNGAATNVIKVGIDTMATGTSQTIAIDLMGYTI